MIKVLIVAGAMNVGGIENQLMHLLRNAEKKEFSIDFTTTVENPYYKSEIEELGSRCLYLKPTKIMRMFGYCIALYKIIKSGNYDIVHSHELFHSGLVLLTAKLAGVRIRFVHAHNCAEGIAYRQKKTLIRKLYNSAMRRLIIRCGTEFCACSTLSGEYLYGKEKTTKPNYHLIFNSVDTTKFLENYYHYETGEFCNDNWINVIQVGRFTAVKNQLFTAKIAKEFKNRNLPIRILCIGNDGGDYEQKVRNAIQEYDISDNLLLLGVRRDIDVLMRKASVFLLPSQYEGMPLVLIEAQSSGLHCVVADTFSHEVDFEIGTVKWLRIDGSVDEWVDAIISSAKESRPDKYTVCEAVYRKGFDSKIFTKKLCSLYRNAVNS